MAVLAVAFVVLAAVPVALTDSDAARTAGGSATGVLTITDTTPLQDEKSYYIAGNLSEKTITIPATVSTGITLFIKSDAQIKIAAADGGSRSKITVYEATGISSGTVTYYQNSGATFTAADEQAALNFKMENGGYYLETSTNLTLAAGVTGTTLQSIVAAYSDHTVLWTTEMAANATMPTFQVKSGETEAVTSVVVSVPQTADTNAFTFKVDYGTENEASVIGPFAASAAAGTLTFNGTRNVLNTVTSNGSGDNITLTAGEIKREKGAVTLGSGVNDVTTNGMYGSTGVAVEIPTTAITATTPYASGVSILKGTTLSNDLVFETSDGNNTIFTVGRELATKDLLSLGWSSTTLTISDSAQPWTGAAITVNSTAETVDLNGQQIGSLTVNSSTKTNVTIKNSTVINGTLTVNDVTTDHSTHTPTTYCSTVTVSANTANPAIVTQNGSIVLGEHVQMTVSSSKGLALLGTASGEGTILDASYANITTPDGTTSNITVSNVSGKSVNADVSVPTAATTTALITKYAEMGYQKIPVGTGLAVNESYTIPDGVYIDATTYGIIINPGATSSIVLTLPSSSTLDLGESKTIAVGYNSALTTKWTEKAKFVVEGKLIGSGTVEGKGSFELASTGAVGPTVKIMTATASGNVKELKWSGEVLTQDLPMYQKVIVPEGETATIQKLQLIRFYGELQVDGTLVIEDEATLLFGMESYTTTTGNNVTYVPQAAKITVSSTGSIQVKEGSTMDIVNATGTASGPVQVDGTMKLANSSSLTVKSTMAESSTGMIGMSEMTAKISVSSSGVLTFNGYLGIDAVTYKYVNVSNSGSVVIDNSSIATRTGAGLGSATISLVADGASVTVDSYVIEGSGTFSTLAINDSGLALAKFGSKTYYAGAVPGSSGMAVQSNNTYSITGAAKDVKVTGELVIAEELSSVADGTALAVKNRMLLSGSVSNGTSVTGTATPGLITLTMGASYPSAASDVSAIANSAYKSATFTSAVAVASETTLAIGQYVNQTNTGLLVVDGYLDMTADGVSTISNSSGTVTVPGIVKIKALEISGGKINAVKYVSKEAVGSSTATFNVYTSLDQAVVGILDASNTNTDKTITLYGIVDLDESVVVKSPINVKFATSNAGTNKLNVGSSDDSDVELTFEKGSKFTSAKNQVDVYGTLYFADKTNDATNKTICDVKVESDDSVDRMYTNIYTALGSAASGSTVVVTREATDADGASQYVKLTRSVTIGEGVTLDVGSSVAPLWLADGVTLTVNGVLDSETDVYAESMFATSASTISGKEASAVVVNGTVQGNEYQYKAGSNGTDVKLSDGAPIAGAYYAINGVNYLSTVEIAESNFAKVSGAVSIYGPVTAGDLSFAKTSSSTGTSVVIYGVTINSRDTALTASSITLDEVSLVVKEEGLLNAIVKNDSASITAYKITGSSGKDLTIADKSGVLSVSGTAVASDESTFAVTTGTVDAGTTSDAFTYTAGDDDNAMVVASGAILEPESVGTIDKLTVDGEFSVPQGKSASIGILTVLGTVDVFAGSDTASASTLTVTKQLWIGADAEEITGASASFSGPVAVNGYAVVKNGASVDAEAQKVLDKITKETEFYVSGTLWITVYNNGSSDVAITYFDNPVITNAYFAGWYNADGEAADPASGADKNIGETGFEKVYASITTKVYHVIILADQGIGDLYLNGNIMSKGMKEISGTGYYYAYWADVEAGDYTVTCKLANGYSGTAVLKDMDGKTVSGNKFTASGTPSTSAGITLNYQLTGIEKSGYTPAVEPEEKDDGLTVTDYLLIVLVILVVVLAVIVAMRLMRS